MLHLGRARLVFGLSAGPVSAPCLLRLCSSPRPQPFSFSSSTATPTRRRAFSTKAHSDDLFDNTAGRWIYNDALRHAERRRVFNVDGLCRLAAQSVDRSPDDIVTFAKLTEGGFNRIFLITMRDGFRMIARIPYPVTVPKYYAVASEAATMAFLRSSGLPVPEVYGYSPVPDNAAETEYIFMEYIRGDKLSEVWPDFGEQEVVSVVHRLVELEAKMMSISFPAGGSLYYAKDLEILGGRPGIPLEDGRFCVGPEVRLPLWFGRRSQLDAERGPYESIEAALVSGAHKELAYLERFGQPLLPFHRTRREAYQYQKQSPLDHVENLHRFLIIAPSLVPKDPTICQFRIRHPDLQHSNIIVSRSPDSNCQVVGLLDWQHASILPLFLSAGIPDRLQNYNDPISHYMIPPSLPENFEYFDQIKQEKARELYYDRLTHYHYVKHMEACNEVHYRAFTEPLPLLRRRLFHHASAAWEGETLALKVALIAASRDWETLTGGDAPCPLVFDAEDVRETMKLDEVQERADGTMDGLRSVLGIGMDGWVSRERYEEVMGRSKSIKEQVLAAAELEGEAVEPILEHWPLDDMDEERYM